MTFEFTSVVGTVNALKAQFFREYADNLEEFGNMIQPVDDYWEGYQRALLAEVEVVRLRAEGLENS